MEIVQRFEVELQKEISSESMYLVSLTEDVIDGKYTHEEQMELANHIERRFFDLEIWGRGPVLYLLTKISPERACVLARRDLENVYKRTRLCAGYLNQVIVSIDSVENFIRSLSAMEVEKTLRIAYALINKLEISDGDFRAPVRKN